MEIFKIKGLILKKSDVGDSDIRFTFFSEEIGKISAMVYGIRKSKKRSIGAYNPLCLTEFTLRKKNEFYSVIESDLIKNFRTITKNIEKLEISLYILDTVNKIYDVNYEKNDFFSKLIEILEFIENIENLESGYKYYIVLSFLRRVMIEQGIYDMEELGEKMGIKLISKYKKISNMSGKKDNFLEIQKKFNNYTDVLKKITLTFESYINEHLQVKLEVKKFIMEDL